MEIWDAYHENGTLAGCDLIRGEPVPEGLFHLVSEILVKHTDGSYLIMQRYFNKIGFPGMFEANAGGSALKGETPLDTAKRELEEETGIKASKLTRIVDPFIERDTLFQSFLCITDCDKDAVTLQQGETIAYKWLSKEAFIKFMDSSECIPVQKSRLTPYLKSIV